MTDTVTVAAADVRCVSEVLVIAARAFGSALGNVPRFGEALEACGRLTDAADRTAMPDDPVAGPNQIAIAHHEMLMAYQRAGFERDEAFSIVMTFIAAGASANAMRQIHG